jgi:hypothetical protein
VVIIIKLSCCLVCLNTTLTPAITIYMEDYYHYARGGLGPSEDFLNAIAALERDDDDEWEDDDGPPSPPSFGAGMSLWDPDTVSPSVESLEPQDVGLAAEVLGLPGRLARRQRDAVTSRASGLADTFMDDTSVPSALLVGDEVIPVFPPESPRRVAAEVAAVDHMLVTSIVWLSGVDHSTVPLGDQERLIRLVGHALDAVLLRFPIAAAVLAEPDASLPSPGGAVPESSPSVGAGSTGVSHNSERHLGRKRPIRRA